MTHAQVSLCDTWQIGEGVGNTAAERAGGMESILGREQKAEQQLKQRKGIGVAPRAGAG